MDLSQSRSAYNEYLTNHIANVKKAYRLLNQFGIFNNILSDEAIIKAKELCDKHDESKWDDPEYDAYRQYFDPTPEEISGNSADDAKDASGKDPRGDRSLFNAGWLHHLHNNPHHWEYWNILSEDNIGSVESMEMPDEYIIEMICDWLSFSIKAQDLSEIHKWYDEKKDGIIMHESVRSKVEEILDRVKSIDLTNTEVTELVESILVEGRDAYLYHGTSIRNLLKILSNDSLKVGKVYGRDVLRWGELKGSISVSRSSSIAEEYGDAILVLDQSKLSSQYKISPIGDYSNHFTPSAARYIGHSKAEEIIREDISDLHKYLVRIDIINDLSKMLTEEAIDQINFYSDKYNIPVSYPNAKELKESSDDINYPQQLNPKLWNDDNTLKDDIANKVTEITDVFLDELKDNGIPISVIDTWIVGSNASYNYTDNSDLDIHIIANLTDSSCDERVLQLLYNYFKSSFNKKYDIRIKGIKVELYIEDVNTTIRSNGIYSMAKRSWIKYPDPIETPDVDITLPLNSLIEEYERVMSDISEMTTSDFIDHLYMIRKIGLTTEGEYSVGNLVFKEFRNLGYLDKLRDKMAKEISNKLSMEGIMNLKESSKVVTRYMELDPKSSDFSEVRSYCDQLGITISDTRRKVKGGPNEGLNYIKLVGSKDSLSKLANMLWDDPEGFDESKMSDLDAEMNEDTMKKSKGLSEKELDKNKMRVESKSESSPLDWESTKKMLKKHLSKIPRGAMSRTNVTDVLEVYCNYSEEEAKDLVNKLGVSGIRLLIDSASESVMGEAVQEGDTIYADAGLEMIDNGYRGSFDESKMSDLDVELTRYHDIEDLLDTATDKDDYESMLKELSDIRKSIPDFDYWYNQKYGKESDNLVEENYNSQSKFIESLSDEAKELIYSACKDAYDVGKLDFGLLASIYEDLNDLEIEYNEEDVYRYFSQLVNNRDFDESVIRYPNGTEVTDIDLDKALDYQYGTDRDKDNSKYTDDEKQKAVTYWIKKTDPSPYDVSKEEVEPLEEAQEWYDGISDGYYSDSEDEDNGIDVSDEYDDAHAKEWSDRHPYGYYNNENDYGMDDSDESINEVTEKVSYSELSKNNKRSSFNESPDAFGIPTDDELDAEYQKKKELIAKKRILAQSKYDSVKSLPLSKIIDNKSKSFTKDGAINKALIDIGSSYGLDIERSSDSYYKSYSNMITLVSMEKDDIPTYTVRANVGLGVSSLNGKPYIEAHIRVGNYASHSDIVDLSVDPLDGSKTVDDVLKLISDKSKDISNKFDKIKKQAESLSSSDSNRSKNYYKYSRGKDLLNFISKLYKSSDINESSLPVTESTNVDLSESDKVSYSELVDNAEKMQAESLRFKKVKRNK